MSRCTTLFRAAILAGFVGAGPGGASAWAETAPANPPATAEAAPDPDRPRVEGEVDIGFFGSGWRGAGRDPRSGGNFFLFGEASATFHLNRQFAVNATLHIEPIGHQEPQGGSIFFRRQGVYLESLNLEYRPVEALTFTFGKYVVPFGLGHEDFPGVLTLFRAHEVYLINEALGVMGRATLPLGEGVGEHAITGAVFQRDRTPLSYLLLGNRRRCCTPDYMRYERNTLADGGPGNNNDFNNFALSLGGENIPALPGFSYHASVMTRGPGQDGLSREWAGVIGLRYDHRWTERVSTRLSAETVLFNSYGGRPIEVVQTPSGPVDLPVSERRLFSTIAAQTTVEGWRFTASWQQDQRKRSGNSLATERYVELSFGREIAFGFSFDVGWQFARLANDTGGASNAQGPVGVIRFHRRF